MAEPRHYYVWVAGRPLTPNERRGVHWAAIARDTALYRDAIAWQAAQAHQGPPLPRAMVRVTLVRTGGRALDPDNAYGTVKACVDGLTVAGGGNLVVDDDERHMILEVVQTRDSWRGVTLDITEVSDEHTDS